MLASKTLHEDPKQMLTDAFAMFDSYVGSRGRTQRLFWPPHTLTSAAYSARDGTGMIDASEFRTVMANLGERFNMQEVEEMMRVPEVDAEGNIKYSGTPSSPAAANPAPAQPLSLSCGALAAELIQFAVRHK